MTRDEAQGWLVELLLDKIRNDPYPSSTQMEIVEANLTDELVADYIQVLIEKAERDNVPSIPLLQRISRVAATLPRGPE